MKYFRDQKYQSLTGSLDKEDHRIVASIPAAVQVMGTNSVDLQGLRLQSNESQAAVELFYESFCLACKRHTLDIVDT